MTKHGPEKPGVLVEWKGDGLVPISASDDEDLRKYPIGSQFRLEVITRLTDKLRRRYWSTLSDVIHRTSIKPTKENLNEALKWDLGRVDVDYDLIGRPRLATLSTADMDDADFKAFYEEAMIRLSELTGYDVEAAAEERIIRQRFPTRR